MLELGRVNDDLMRELAEVKRAQDTHQVRLRFLNHFVDNLPTAFQMMSVQDGYRVVQWNHGAQALYGLTAEEAMGCTVHELWPPEHADRMHAADLELVAGGVMQDFENRAIATKNRGIVQVHMRKFPLKNASGVVTHLLITAEDITERLATKARLQQSQALFQSLTRLSSDWFWEVDDQFRFLHAPQRWAEQPTVPTGDFMGKTPWELGDTPHDPGAWTLHRTQLERRETFRDFEFERVDQNGHRVVISLSGEPHCDASGNFAGYRGVGNDISARKQAEAALQSSEARFRAVVAALAEGVIVRDANGRILDCNTSAERFYGRTLAQMKGLTSVAPHWQVLCEDGSLMPEQEWPSAVARHTGLAQSEVVVRYIKPDGAELWALVNLQPLFEGDSRTPSGFVSTVTDITASKRAQMEIVRLNVVLEDRVLRRTAQLEAANAELEAFAYSVAHDLRAPLSAIDGFSVLLQKTMPAGLGERARHCLARIRSGVRRMGELTDALLFLAHLSRTKLHWASVDMSAEVTEILKRYAQSEPDRRVQTTLEPGLRVWADASLLRQVLESLLANAWKFTSKKSCAVITVGQQRGADGQPVYFVRDNGAGFDMAYADKLFGAFQRLHSPQEFAGSGFGLATVQRIITRHGGKVWACACVDEGSTFYFTLGSDPVQAAPGDSRYQERSGMAPAQLAPSPASLFRSAEDALMASDEQFRSAFEHAAIGMSLLAIDKRRLRVNSAFCRMLGYSETELLARTVQEITHPDDVAWDVLQSQRALDGEIEAYQCEKRYIHQSGRMVWVHLSCSLVRDADRRPVHFISQLQDITEHKLGRQN
ncbi:MAG: domain S-box protein [Polaromonas sp.]|nr:domain S-box protein [Polaromonas sp.]